MSAYIPKTGSDGRRDELTFTTVLPASRGDTNTVRRLVKELGADVSITDNDGETPLHAATRNGHGDTVSALLGAEVAISDNHGSTPLHAAATNGHAGIARVLVKEFGADVAAVDNFGDTPLHKSARYGHSNTACVLSVHPFSFSRGKWPQSRFFLLLKFWKKNGIKTNSGIRRYPSRFVQ